MKNIKKLSIFIFLLLISSPLFFEIYRIMSFDVMPHDDYSQYLLYIAEGGGIGSLPAAPYFYRFLSVLIAVPFYFILPQFRFSNVTPPVLINNQMFTSNAELSPFLRASEALSFTSFLSIVLAISVIFLIVRNKYKGEVSSAILSLFLGLSLFHFTGFYMIDPIAILWICLIIYYEEKRVKFFLLLMAAAFLNEKILIVFFLKEFFSLILRKKFEMKIVYISFSLIAFLGLKVFFNVGGNENQTDLSTFYSGFLNTFHLSLGVKGGFMNLLPLVLLTIMFIFAYLKEQENKKELLASFLMLLTFTVISMCVDVKYSVGRIIMYTFPFFVPYFSIYLDKEIKKLF